MRIVLLICTLTLLACNPVKQVLKDARKFDIVKEAVIRSGACVNDTVTVEFIKDSIIYKDSLINSMILVSCKDFDTLMPDGTRIMVSSGVIKYKPKYKEVKTTKTITNYIRDRSIEDYLRKDITKRDSTITVYMKLYGDSQKKQIEAMKENTRLKWKMFWVVLVSFVWIFRWQILKLVKII